MPSSDQSPILLKLPLLLEFELTNDMNQTLKLMKSGKRGYASSVKQKQDRAIARSALDQVGARLATDIAKPLNPVYPHYRWRVTFRRDSDGLYGCLKSIHDGLVMARIIEDDRLTVLSGEIVHSFHRPSKGESQALFLTLHQNPPTFHYSS